MAKRSHSPHFKARATLKATREAHGQRTWAQILGAPPSDLAVQEKGYETVPEITDGVHDYFAEPLEGGPAGEHIQTP